GSSSRVSIVSKTLKRPVYQSGREMRPVHPKIGFSVDGSTLERGPIVVSSPRKTCGSVYVLHRQDRFFQAGNGRGFPFRICPAHKCLPRMSKTLWPSSIHKIADIAANNR